MKIRLTATAALVAAAFAPAIGSADSFYVVTNKADENTVIGYTENADGKYEMMGEYATGGKGTGDLEIPALKKDETHPLLNGDDPLISANAIAASEDGKHIVSVNPGDGTIALSMRKDDGSLEFVNTASASDQFPTSVAVHGDMVVAAAVGESNMHGSIGLFMIKDGELLKVKDSRRDLQARPSTIDFSSNGKFVVVDELVTGKIKTFEIVDGQLSDEPVSVIDSPRDAEDRFQAIPVGFAIRDDADKDVILMSEARFLTPEFGLREEADVVPQTPKYSWQTGSLSSYTLGESGELALVSGDVLTGSEVEGGEISNCWVTLSEDGKTLWAANALSSSISSFDIAEDGTATLKNATAYKDESEELFFSDMSVSVDGDQLYQLVGNKGEVIVFDIEDNGDLTMNHKVSGLPELGAYGLLAL